MKLKHRALALLLSLAIVLTFMPAMAFAAAPEGANTKKAVELKYEGDLEYTVEEDATWFSGFYEAGNKITVVWDDGTSDVYLCKEYQYKGSEGRTWTDVAYFAENETPHMVVNEDGGQYPDNTVDFSTDFEAGGKINISYYYEYYDEDSGWDNSDTVSTTVQGIRPTSISYEGPAFTYEPWEGPDSVYPYAKDAKIIIHYSDNKTTKTLVCKGWENSEDGDTWTTYNYFWEGEEPKIVTDEEGYKYADNSVYVEFKEEEATKAGLPVEFRGAKGMIPIEEKQYFKPVSLEFKQAESGTVYAQIGQKYLYGLGGEGNTIRLTDANGNVRDYVYGKYDDDYWTFFYTDEEGKHSLWIYDIVLSKRIPKGTNTVSGKISFECEGEYTYTLPIKVKVKATQYYTEVLYKQYTYTGKKITPKVVVKYYNGKSMKTMPKSWYTSNAKKKSAIGQYRYKITLKKKYQKKYGKTLYGWYSIIPKKPTIKSVKGGAGKLTVTWSKLSKSERKNVSGFVVQIAKNSKFTKDVEYFWVEKNTASKYVVNYLDPGKYYVRVVTYKDVKRYGSFWSNPSKTKSTTVK